LLVGRPLKAFTFLEYKLMYKVKVIRRIFDGSSIDDSKNFASTSRDLHLPISPFSGMTILMPSPEVIKEVTVYADTQEVSCFLDDHYAKRYPSAWSFQERIDQDALNGMTLIFNNPLHKA